MIYIILLCLIVSFVLQTLSQKMKREEKRHFQIYQYISYLLIIIAILLTIFC